MRNGNMRQRRNDGGRRQLGSLLAMTTVKWPDGNMQVAVVDWGHLPALRKFAGFSRGAMLKGAEISTRRIRTIADVPPDRRAEVLERAHPVLKRKLGVIENLNV